MVQRVGDSKMIGKQYLALIVAVTFHWCSSVVAQSDLPIVRSVPHQPLVSATKRLVDALDFAGSPLSASAKAELIEAFGKPSPNGALAIQRILDPLCLAGIHINPESRVKVQEGPVAKKLMQQGWRVYLVKIHNEAGINPKLAVESPQAKPLYEKGKGPRQKPMSDEKLVRPDETYDRWLDISVLARQPLKERLSGLNLEYHLVVLFSRDAGKREAEIAFNIGQGTQDIGFRNSVPILFDCENAVDVRLGIKDIDGKPTTAALVIRDSFGRVYPNPSRRLAPDFFFHQQIYRADGESVALPPGDYSIMVSRGPEYLAQNLTVTIPDSKEHLIELPLKRWIHLAPQRWFSGDHHVHAAGCAHYDSPTEGVGPADMMRHILGEDLNVGCVLSWGPCWYTQKAFFEGETHKLSTKDYLMRYDVEVSGFPSSHAGHLCLLNLKEDDYPGTKLIEEWPSWTIPVLSWGKEQGGVVGYSHSGWGLALPDKFADGSRRYLNNPRGRVPPQWRGTDADTLPDYEMPPFDGIGANEYIVATALDVCDFISSVDTPAIWELNIWYHTLNCGMTSRISGETDFPCIYGDKVGLGRIYVKLDEDQPLNYENWIEGLKDGRSYCGDGLSHVIDFKVNEFELGTREAEDTPPSRMSLGKPQTVNVSFKAAAMLDATQSEVGKRIQNTRLDRKPYWHLERARLGGSRKVPVELVVNGEVVAKRELVADGMVQPFSFDVPIEKSSWIAVRILPSVHTNPIFVHVDGKPIRANKRSAQWCIDAVETCWKSKMALIRESERSEARAAYDKAVQIYQTVLAECEP
ncbi:MAG: CehA/McbA family metallohydrolase [Planctomycetota bacterium]